MSVINPDPRGPSNWTDATALSAAEEDLAERVWEFCCEEFRNRSQEPTWEQVVAYLTGRRVLEWPERES